MRKPAAWIASSLTALYASALYASDEGVSVSGAIKPDGPPLGAPVRIDAGKSCIIDVRQGYVVDGSLTGSFDIDYRILVAGPCGSPPGTFDEQWIARGVFTGAVNGDAAEARFSYTATVKAGGKVNGRIVFGQGLGGTLRIEGSFAAGELSYSGRVRRPTASPPKG